MIVAAQSLQAAELISLKKPEIIREMTNILTEIQEPQKKESFIMLPSVKTTASNSVSLLSMSSNIRIPTAMILNTSGKICSRSIQKKISHKESPNSLTSLTSVETISLKTKKRARESIIRSMSHLKNKWDPWKKLATSTIRTLKIYWRLSKIIIALRSKGPWARMGPSIE